MPAQGVAFPVITGVVGMALTVTGRQTGWVVPQMLVVPRQTVALPALPQVTTI